MTKADNYAKMMKDMFGKLPMDTTALQDAFKIPHNEAWMQDAFKSQAAMMERMAKVALEAAEKSTEISNSWTKATLAKAGEVATTKEGAADYSKAMNDFASAQAELASEHAAAFAEVAKKLQTDTVELMMASAKDMQEEAAAAGAKMTKSASSKTQAKKSTDTK